MNDIVVCDGWALISILAINQRFWSSLHVVSNIATCCNSTSTHEMVNRSLGTPRRSPEPTVRHGHADIHYGNHLTWPQTICEAPWTDNSTVRCYDKSLLCQKPGLQGLIWRSCLKMVLSRTTALSRVISWYYICIHIQSDKCCSIHDSWLLHHHSLR